MELFLVQILFVVANTFMQTKRVKVSKGFLWTAIEQELDGIKENR